MKKLLVLLLIPLGGCVTTDPIWMQPYHNHYSCPPAIYQPQPLQVRRVYIAPPNNQPIEDYCPTRNRLRNWGHQVYIQ